MSEINRLQSYLRIVAQLQYQVVSIPPFSLFFHYRETFKFFNYAIPDRPDVEVANDLAMPLGLLRAEFRQRDRLPRFEFIDDYTPSLAAILAANGFIEESRLHLMVCTPESYRAVDPPPGVEVVRLTKEAALGDIRDYAMTQQLGFEPDNSKIPPDNQLELKRQELDRSRSYLARKDGQAACAGLYTFPFDGLSEVAGIATRESFRRQGIGAYLTSVLVGDAFKDNVDMAFLSAADARAGRVYERIGFYSFATMLAYSDPVPA